MFAAQLGGAAACSMAKAVTAAATQDVGFEWLIGLFAAGLLFVLSRAFGAVIGEYAKLGWFKKFETENEKLKKENAKLKDDVRKLRGDIETANRILRASEGENERLLMKCVQANREIAELKKQAKTRNVHGASKFWRAIYNIRPKSSSVDNK